MGNIFTSDQVGGIVRALLAAVGGWAVSKGLVDSSTATTAAGAAAAAFAGVWSWYTNSPAAMINSVNSAPNGVKVVAADSPSPAVTAPHPD